MAKSDDLQKRLQNEEASSQQIATEIQRTQAQRDDRQRQASDLRSRLSGMTDETQKQRDELKAQQLEQEAAREASKLTTYEQNKSRHDDAANRLRQDVQSAREQERKDEERKQRERGKAENVTEEIAKHIVDDTLF